MEDVGYLKLFCKDEVKKIYLDMNSRDFIQENLNFFIAKRYYNTIRGCGRIYDFLGRLLSSHNRFLVEYKTDTIQVHLQNMETKVYIVGRSIPLELVDRKSLKDQ